MAAPLQDTSWELPFFPQAFSVFLRGLDPWQPRLILTSESGVRSLFHSIVGSEDSQPPAEDISSFCPALSQVQGWELRRCPCEVRLLQRNGVWTRRLLDALSPMSPALDPPTPVRAQLVRDSLGHVLERVSLKELPPFSF